MQPVIAAYIVRGVSFGATNMADEDTSAAAALKEFQEMIAKEMGLNKLAQIDQHCSQIMRPYLAHDGGVITLTYLALKITAHVEGLPDVE